MKILKYKGYKKDWLINKMKEEKLRYFSFFNFIFLLENKQTLDLIIKKKFLNKNDYNKCFLIKQKNNLYIADEKMIYDEEIIEEIRKIEEDNIYKVSINKQSTLSSIIHLKIIRISNYDVIEDTFLNILEKKTIIEFLELFQEKEIKMSQRFQDLITEDLKNRFLKKHSINIEEFNFSLFIKNDEENYDIELTNIHGKRLLVRNVKINFYNSNINFAGLDDFISL